MKEEKSLIAASNQTSTESGPSSTEDAQHHWQGVVKRRSFLKSIGIATAAVSAGALLSTETRAQSTRSTGKLSRGDTALLRFAAAVELVEADL